MITIRHFGPGIRTAFKIMLQAIAFRMQQFKRRIQAEIIRRKNLRSKIHFPYLFLYWYLFGLLIFHTYAQWQSGSLWNYLYYWWEGLVNVFALLAVFNPKPINWRNFWPILLYAIIRVCIYTIILVAKTDMNAKPIVAMLFILSLAASVFLTIKENRRWNRTSGSQS